MGISSVTATNSMSGMRMLTAVSTDSKVKNIENEIASARQQMQKISPKEELSVSEKEIERKKLQNKISGLHTDLKQHQETLRKSQKREIMMKELQEDQEQTRAEKPEAKGQTAETSLDQESEKNLSADSRQAGRPGTVLVSNSDGTVIIKGTIHSDEKPSIDTEEGQPGETEEKGIAETGEKDTGSDSVKDPGLSHKKIYAIVSADSFAQQADRQGTVIARTRDGIAILKGEINQDEMRGTDTEKKQAELEKLEKKEQRAISFQSSVLGEANKTMTSAPETGALGIKGKTSNSAANNAFFSAIKISQEASRTAQQNLHFSFVD